MSKYARKVANKLRNLEGEIMGYILERLEGMTTVRVNNREGTELSVYENLTADCYALSSSAHFAQGDTIVFIIYYINNIFTVIEQGRL